MANIPDSIRHKFRRIIESSKGDDRFKQMLIQGTDENFKWAYQLAYERGYGKPLQSVDMEINDNSNRPTTESLIETIRALREELGSLKQGIGMAAGK